MEKKMSWEKRYEEIKKFLSEYTPDFSSSEIENLEQLMEKAKELIKDASILQNPSSLPIDLFHDAEQEDEYRKFERLHPAF